MVVCSEFTWEKWYDDAGESTRYVQSITYYHTLRVVNTKCSEWE